MAINNILELCKELSHNELYDLILSLKELHKKKYKDVFVEIRIHPGEYIVTTIIKETGFYCYHEKAIDNPMGRGTHIIAVPKEKYTNELKKELINKYDDKWENLKII